MSSDGWPSNSLVFRTIQLRIDFAPTLLPGIRFIAGLKKAAYRGASGRRDPGHCGNLPRCATQAQGGLRSLPRTFSHQGFLPLILRSVSAACLFRKSIALRLGNSLLRNETEDEPQP